MGVTTAHVARFPLLHHLPLSIPELISADAQWKGTFTENG